MTARDWPFGPFLTQAIKRSGESKRAIARAAGISEARLRQLEDGFQKSNGVEVPIRTTPQTVTRLSRVLGFPLHEGLVLAGLEAPSGDPAPAGEMLTLKAWTVAELLYEVRERFSEISGESPAAIAAGPPGDGESEGPLTVEELTARAATIVQLEELAEHRRSEGDRAGAREVAQLAFDLSRQMHAMAEEEEVQASQASPKTAPTSESQRR